MPDVIFERPVEEISMVLIFPLECMGAEAAGDIQDIARGRSF